MNKKNFVNSKGQLISKCLFGVFNFFQKTNENKSTMRYHSSEVEFIQSFFGRIHGLTICFRVLLTFRHIRNCQKSVRILFDLKSYLDRCGFVSTKFFDIMSFNLIKHILKTFLVRKGWFVLYNCADFYGKDIMRFLDTRERTTYVHNFEFLDTCQSKICLDFVILRSAFKCAAIVLWFLNPFIL